jgi:Flp pilus assembly CpaE family ATPase
VVDTGIGLPERATSLLELADVVCVVTSPDRASLNATRELLGLLEDMPQPVRRQFLVLNRASVDRELGKAGVLLGREPDAIISADELYAASADAGQPLVTTQHGDTAEKELSRMAEAVRRILGMESAVSSSQLAGAGARDD